MDAIVFRGPFDVATERRDTPKLILSTDVILKVQYLGLCGTDLHTYRGHITGPKNEIIGHEFTGEIVAKGDAVNGFKLGDTVVACFTTQCGKCYYCKNGLSGVCVETNTFGKVGLPGGQAEYVRIPNAVNTLIKIEPNDPTYVMMADIFITGYYGVKKIVNYFAQEQVEGIAPLTAKDITVLQIGAGPVGLCALRVLKHFGFSKVVVVDSVPSRLEQAKKFGAYKVINFEEEPQGVSDFVTTNLNLIGFDAVLEVVGAQSSLKSAFDHVRMNGFISCLGMAHGDLPFNGLECYLKSVNISFGRCHAWSLFAEALRVFKEVKGEFTSFIDCKVGAGKSKEAFEWFDKHKVNKVVFEFGESN